MTSITGPCIKINPGKLHQIGKNLVTKGENYCKNADSIKGLISQARSSGWRGKDANDFYQKFEAHESECRKMGDMVESLGLAVQTIAICYSDRSKDVDRLGGR